MRSDSYIDYIDAGPGYCTDGSGGIDHTSDLPAMYSPTSNYSECEYECTHLDKCIAFNLDFNRVNACTLRFASKDDLLAQPNLSGYDIWWKDGCENNCKTNYTGSGLGRGTGRCWVKHYGNLLLFPQHLK